MGIDTLALARLHDEDAFRDDVERCDGEDEQKPIHLFRGNKMAGLPIEAAGFIVAKGVLDGVWPKTVRAGLTVWVEKREPANRLIPWDTWDSYQRTQGPRR